MFLCHSFNLLEYW